MLDYATRGWIPFQRIRSLRGLVSISSLINSQVVSAGLEGMLTYAHSDVPAHGEDNRLFTGSKLLSSQLPQLRT